MCASKSIFHRHQPPDRGRKQPTQILRPRFPVPPQHESAHKEPYSLFPPCLALQLRPTTPQGCNAPAASHSSTHRLALPPPLSRTTNPVINAPSRKFAIFGLRQPFSERQKFPLTFSWLYVRWCCFAPLRLRDDDANTGLRSSLPDASFGSV